MKNQRTIVVQGHPVLVGQVAESEFINLSQLAEASLKEGQDASQVVANWLRLGNTMEFLALWEQLYGAKESFNESGYRQLVLESLDQNGFSLSPQRWAQSTGATGIEVKRGRTGGVFAHQDIALEFCTWRSPVFKLLVLKEFQRLKEAEEKALDPEWTVRRVIAKANYVLQTDAVKDHLVPLRNLPQNMEGIVYAEEAELLNLAVFHITSKQWREENSNLARQGRNLRDEATVPELIVIGNLEGMNAQLIKEGYSHQGRLKLLSEIAAEQLAIINRVNLAKSMQDTAKTLSQSKPLNSFDAGLRGLLAIPPPPKPAKRAKGDQQEPPQYNDPK